MVYGCTRTNCMDGSTLFTCRIINSLEKIEHGKSIKKRARQKARWLKSLIPCVQKIKKSGLVCTALLHIYIYIYTFCRKSFYDLSYIMKWKDQNISSKTSKSHSHISMYMSCTSANIRPSFQTSPHPSSLPSIHARMLNKITRPMMKPTLIFRAVYKCEVPTTFPSVGRLHSRTLNNYVMYITLRLPPWYLLCTLTTTT